MELAAIASAAVPGLAPTGVTGAPDDSADFDAALLVDAAGKHWRVRSPRHAEASMRLETELQALRAFTPAVKAELPFLIPHIAGSVRQGNLSTFVYSHLTGSTRDLESLAAAGRGMAAELGRVLAAIHELPKSLVQEANLPSYGANEFRQRKLNELDQAATTGRIPSVLLRRWEHALEDVTLWRFSPTVVHGDLHEDHLLISGSRVSAVTGWTDLRIGDPADDFAWLAAVSDPGFVDGVYAAYNKARGGTPDQHLARRAALAAEFALAQWMVRGLAMEDPQMIAEAQDMMASLEADVKILDQASADQRRQAPRSPAPRAVAVETPIKPAGPPASSMDRRQGGSDVGASGDGSGDDSGAQDGSRAQDPLPRDASRASESDGSEGSGVPAGSSGFSDSSSFSDSDGSAAPGGPSPAEIDDSGSPESLDSSDSSNDDDAAPARSGSHSAAVHRGTLPKGSGSSRPAVTLLRPEGSGAAPAPAPGSGDDAATSALPIISLRR
jgi:aminoglycoside phosphotransferase (APT) family kinase protein